MLTALIGTTIAPWQFFYLQAGFVEKRVAARQYEPAKPDVMVGSISCMAIVFFIIVCTAATLHAHGITEIIDASAGGPGVRPVAGRWAADLFAFGFLNASLFAASILPLSTAHVICEGLGFEAGLDHKVKEAPAFYSLYTGLDIRGWWRNHSFTQRAFVEDSGSDAANGDQHQDQSEQPDVEPSAVLETMAGHPSARHAPLWPAAYIGRPCHQICSR